MAERVTKEEIISGLDPHGYLPLEAAKGYYDALMKLPDRGSLLEIGTGRGDSATFFALAKPKWIIYTVDQYGVASDYPAGYSLKELGKNVVTWRNAGLISIIPIIANSFDMPWGAMIDALYIDGDHRYEAVKSDFERFAPFLKPDGIIMMDDYGLHDTGRVEVDTYVNNKLGDCWDIWPVGSGVILRRKI